jgi:hypothetical protein
MNPIGLTAAAAAFVGIWFGHVAVRKIEANAPIIWLPAILLACAGGALEYWAAAIDNPALAVAAGIIGITLLWDALELFRQEGRVRRGHAPANPTNPRHKRLLKAFATRATQCDPLKREAL